MPVKKLKEFLDRNQVKYVSIQHSLAYTAQQIAALTHTPGKELAKTVVILIDGRMALAVLPASLNVDFGVLKEVTGASDVRLAHEPQFEHAFPGCELGAMPPFGNLYGMDVYVAESLTQDETIAFNAGSHTELIRLAYKDFERLVKPKIVAFATFATA